MSNLSGATTAVFVVKLSAALEVAVNVDWQTKDGTAKAGTDYEAASGTVTFEPGETTKQIQVIAYGREAGDTQSKTFGILLYPPENAILDQTLTEVEIQVVDDGGITVTSLVVATGPRGLKGDPGLSTYELAKLQGYEGSLSDWINSQNPSAAMLTKTLRIPDATIPEMPPLADMEGKILAFSGGKPIGVLPESGSAADVLVELAKPTGATKSTASSGRTVQQEIDLSEANSREHWRRTLADAGLNLVDGSFEEGATVTSSNDAVWFMAGGQCYTWGAEPPKTVPERSTPLSSGGIGPEFWNAVDLKSLRANLGSGEGLKLIGQCAHLNELRATEPSFSGQQIYLESLYGGWAATASGMPWGGGKLRHIASLPAELQIDDGGSIFKTSGGKCWVREELLTGLGEIRVEWYLSGGPSLLEDGTASLQAAADTARLWAQHSDRNKTVRLVFPSLLRITDTVNIYTRGVRVDGNHGMLLITSDMSYTKYTDLSTNTYITTSPDTHADVTVGINLTHGAGGNPSPGFPNPAYSGQEFIKDLNLAYGIATGVSTYQLTAMADNGVAAICHWGTSTVAAAQGFMTNVSFQNFGVGYINGNNVWGVDFYECKWSGCWIPMWLINGADNAERYTLFGCVMQNGYRCVYSPWGGDFNIVKGSYVWNTGPYFEFPTAGNMIDLSPSRIEMVNTSKPLLIVGTSIETGATAQTYPLVKLHGAMLLLDASTVQPANYLFSVSKYAKLVVEDNTWSNKNMTNLANLKLLNPSDTGGKVLFRNNTMRVGLFSEFARDNRLLTSTVPAGRLSSSNITLSGSNAAKATISVSGAALTLTVNESASGSMALLLRVPVDIDMTEWDSFSWKCVFSEMNISNAWNIQAFASVQGADYVNNRVDLGVASLNSVTDISDVCSNNSYGFKRIQKRADGGWDRIPTEVYFYISSAGAQTAGEKFTITRLGLLGY